MTFSIITKLFQKTVLLTSCLLLLSCSDKTLRLGVTTTLEDSGLLNILIRNFKKEHEISITPVVSGSGQLFSLIERGDVDIAISHEPKGEEKLLQKNIIKDRIPIFYNRFVIIGPTNNPANISNTKSASQALQHIQIQQQLFISRGDQSGTHKMELALRREASNNSVEFIFETGSGMGATLNIAINHNAYTLVDLGTWLNFGNKQQHQILWENQNQLINPYHLLMTHSKNPGNNIFKQWLSSENAKTLIRNYRLQGQTVFYNSTNH